MRIHPRSDLSIRTWQLLLVAAALLPAAGGFAWHIAHEVQEARNAAYAKVKILADDVAANLDLTLRDNEALLSMVATEFRGDPPQRAPRFDPDQFMRMHPQAVYLGVRDLRANSIYSLLDPIAPVETLKLRWVEQGLRSESFAVGGAFLGPVSGRWVTQLTYPVRDAHGKRSGFVNLALDLLALNQRMLGSVPRNAIVAVVAVVDGEEKFLLRSIDPEQWIGKIAGSPKQSAQEAERFRHDGFFAAPGADDVQRLYALVKIPRTGWRVVAGLPEDEVLAPARALLVRSIAIGFVVLLLVVALAWWLADIIARPIRSLAAIAGNIARGDTAARAHVSGPDEIKTVAQEFNHMLDARKRAEAALRESETRYRSLFQSMLEGFAYCRMLFENGRPLDFVYLEVNPAFETLTGLKNIIGKKVTEVIPGIRESNPELFERYGRVASTGEPVSFEFYLVPLAMWLSVSVFCPGKGYFVAVFNNITERKQSEDELRISRRQLRALAARLDTVREQETAVLAREIHDELGQVLTGLKMDLFWLSQRLPKDLPLLVEKTASMSALVDATLQTVRDISGRLRLRVLEDLGLIPAIESQVQEFAKRSGVKCEVVSSVDIARLGSARSTAVFRIVQESLTNIARHAGATKADISLHEESGCLILEVRDNGKGIRAEEVASAQSLGLLGMHERALVFGGGVTVEGFPGKGTVVTLRMPFPSS